MSTVLVATAMATLATAVAGLSGHIGDLASSTGVANAGYVETDEAAASELRIAAP
jgi:hypothetical protein